MEISYGIYLLVWPLLPIEVCSLPLWSLLPQVPTSLGPPSLTPILLPIPLTSSFFPSIFVAQQPTNHLTFSVSNNELSLATTNTLSAQQ